MPSFILFAASCVINATGCKLLIRSSSIAGRYIHANVKYFRQRTDAIFFEHELAADKHRPRGKAYLRLMEIENMANTMKFKALQEKIRQMEASNAGN